MTLLVSSNREGIKGILRIEKCHGLELVAI